MAMKALRQVFERLTTKNRFISRSDDKIQCDDFTVKIVRTERKKTIAFKVSDGSASVVVPKNLSYQDVVSLVKKKQRWIKEKLNIQQSLPELKIRNFIPGEYFDFLGQSCPLNIEKASQPHLIFQDEIFTAYVRNPEVDNARVIKSLFKKWYQGQAEKILLDKTELYAKIIGVNPGRISFKSFKSRWGSCSINGDLQYNWRIVMAPEEIINYLVVHELCHILHHNHSSVYWRTVARFYPEYKQSRAWLKINGRLLVF
jgi:predicted metal-dependent hydrolase